MPHAERLLRALPVLFALIPLVAGVCTVLFADLAAPVALLDFQFREPVLLLLFVLALAFGIHKVSWRGSLARDERIALAVFVMVGLFTTLFRAERSSVAGDMLLYRIMLVFCGVALFFLITGVARGLRQAMLWAVALQPILHLPVLAWLYVTFPDDSIYNWRGGPAGYWHVRVWGMELTAAIGAAVALLGFDGGRWRRAAVPALLVVLWALLFFSGTRGGVAALVLGLLLSLALFPRATVGVLLPVGVTAVAGLFLSLLLIPPEPAYGILNSVAETTAGATADEMSAGRITLALEAVRIWREHLFFGVGYGQMRFFAEPPLDRVYQPHNEVVHWLMSFGLIGGGALMYLLLRQWGHAYGALRRQNGPDRTAIGAFLGLNAMIVFGQVDGALLHAEPVFLVIILLVACRTAESPGTLPGAAGSPKGTPKSAPA